MTQPKSHQGWGLAEGSGTHAKPQRLYQVPPAHRLPKPSTACKQIYTSYKSMRQRGYTTASDKQRRGRQPDLSADPQPPSAPHSRPLPSPHPHAPLNPSPGRSSPSALRDQPCCVEPVVAAAWPTRPSHPTVGGLWEAGRADALLRWAAGCPPPGHLQASAALPCSSPAPKRALGSSGGSRAPPPSRALRFFDIWSVFGS